MIKLGEYFNSVQIVIFFLFLFIIGLTGVTATVLYDAYSNMHPVARYLSSILQAFVTEGFLLVITVNSSLISNPHIRKSLPIIFGIYTIITFLFHFNAFDQTADDITTCKRWFFSIVIGTVNYFLNEIFNNKWKERVNQLLEKRKKDDQLVIAGEHIVTLTHQLVTKDDQLVRLNDQLVTLQLEIEELRPSKQKMIEALQELQEARRKAARPKMKGMHKKEPSDKMPEG